MPSKSQKPRVGIYARVSTTDKGQDPETQLAELREYSRRRGFKVVGEFVDLASGRDDTRPRYRELLELARRRRVDVVLVWRYDRFARSLSALVNALSDFQARGVDFISHQEDVDTTTPHGKLFFALVSGFAEFESSLISERVRAGMARAKKQKKRISRPPLDDARQGEIRKLQKEGHSLRTIGRLVEVSHMTAARYIEKPKKRKLQKARKQSQPRAEA